MGETWNALNVGIRIRHLRSGNWKYPLALAGIKMAFGLCSGTAAPLGSVAPANFIGIATGTGWNRMGQYNWWNAGYRVLTAIPSGETEHGSGLGSIRVSTEEEAFSSAWYCRFERTAPGQIKLTWFIPTGTGSQNESDYLTQLALAKWNSSINGHSGHIENTVTISVDEITLGPLDSLNIISSIENFTSSVLRGIEFISVRAQMLS